MFFIIMYGIITTLSQNRHTRCDELGIRHIWTSKGEEGKEYTICQACKYIPSSYKKGEGDNHDL